MSKKNCMKNLLLISILLKCSVLTAQTGSRDTSAILTLRSVKPTVAQLFDEMKKSSYTFVYAIEDIKLQKKIHFKETYPTIGLVLNRIAAALDLSYRINDNLISFRKSQRTPAPMITSKKDAPFIGEICDEDGKPLLGVTVQDESTGRNTITDQDGKFQLPYFSSTRIITLSCVGFERKTIRVPNQGDVRVTLKRTFNQLNEVVVLGYGTARRKTTTASIAAISGKELARGYNMNPISALQGKLSGVLITDANGAPGTTSRVQVRGQQSIGEIPGVHNLPPNEPLILVNLIPWVACNKSVSKLISEAGDPQARGIPGGINSLKNINGNDIEKIEVLKDADATAIYGSRGAHGVIHVTTKRGEAGHVKFSANVTQGAAATAFIPELLNTRQFVEMRTEAILAGNETVNARTAPELVKWDTTRYTNWPKYMFGNTASMTQVYLTARGGNAAFNFFASAGYSRESVVLPVDLRSERGSLHVNVGYQPVDRLRTQVSFLLGKSEDNLVNFDPTNAIRLAPNAPALTDAAGNFIYEETGVAFANPRAALENPYSAKTRAITVSMLTEYSLSRHYSIRINSGMNTMRVSEGTVHSIAANRPVKKGRSESAATTYTGWVFEPQFVYKDSSHIRKRNLSLMLGTTLLGQTSDWLRIERTGFPNDTVIHDPKKAEKISNLAGATTYRYEGFFGRLNIDWKEKYYINLTGRVDGSSRIGKNNRFAVYGSIGTAWLFVNEKYIKDHFRFLSHGKLRLSLGTSGNDNVGDYRFLETWEYNADDQSNGGNRTLNQLRLNNSKLDWEQNLKTEAAIELEFLHRLSFTAAFYCNRTSRQFVALEIPEPSAAAAMYGVNHQAIVQNTGAEFTLQSNVRINSKVQWVTQVVITFPKNKLLSFKDWVRSPYNKTLEPGYSLTVQKGYVYEGVDPGTGLYKFKDFNGDHNIDSLDEQVIGNFDPKMYYGLSNRLTIGNVEVALFIEGRKQQRINPISNSYVNTSPGRPNKDMLSNHPSIVWDRWRKEGDIARLQKYSISNSAIIADANKKANSSNLMLMNGSYLRLRSVSISWNLPPRLMGHLKITGCKFYLEALNLLTFTAYKGGDPTIFFTTSVPSTQSLAAGVEVML